MCCLEDYTKRNWMWIFRVSWVFACGTWIKYINAQKSKDIHKKCIRQFFNHHIRLCQCATLHLENLYWEKCVVISSANLSLSSIIEKLDYVVWDIIFIRKQSFFQQGLRTCTCVRRYCVIVIQHTAALTICGLPASFINSL